MMHSRQPPRRQQGVVLFLALIALVMLTLAGVALLRSVGANVFLAGNIAFREAAVHAADSGIEDAIGWMQSLSASDQEKLKSDGSNSNDSRWKAYRANWQEGLDPTDLENSGTSQLWNDAYQLASKVAGNNVFYVIHRLCYCDGSPTGSCTNKTDEVNQCLKVTTSTTTSVVSHRDCGYGGCPPAGAATSTAYYRITARAVGPRNTQTFVQVIVQ